MWSDWALIALLGPILKVFRPVEPTAAVVSIFYCSRDVHVIVDFKDTEMGLAHNMHNGHPTAAGSFFRQWYK